MVPKGNGVFKSRDIQTNSLELYKKGTLVLALDKYCTFGL